MLALITFALLSRGVTADWQVVTGKKIKLNLWGEITNLTLRQEATDACGQAHQEPDCGVGPPGLAGAKQGCPQNQREGCLSNGPLHQYWCHPPNAPNSNGIDPNTGQAQVLDDVAASDIPAGALCRDHCRDWPTFNRINNGDNPPRLSACKSSWGCQAWTWDGNTCFFFMYTPAQIGESTYPTEPCASCVSGFNSNALTPPTGTYCGHLGEYYTRLDGSETMAVATLTFNETGKFAFTSTIEDPLFRCPALIPYTLENSGIIKLDDSVCPGMLAGGDGPPSNFNFTFAASSDSINFNGVLDLGTPHTEFGTLTKGGDCSANHLSVIV